MTHTEQPDKYSELKAIANRLGAELVPFEAMQSHLIHVTGMGNMGRIEDQRLDEMTEDELRDIIEKVTTLPEVTPLIYLGLRKTSRYHSRPYYLEAK